MPQIGEFTRTKSGFAGYVRTLTLDLEVSLTKAEAIEKAVERFDAADVDGDGILTGEELRKGAKKMRDKVKGGKEGRRGEDRKAHPQRDASKLFERLDADGNGSLSEEEFAKMLEMGRKHRGPRG